MSTTYNVVVQRDGRFWFIDVPLINRSTQARWASEVEPMARDLIATMTDLDMDQVDIDVEWVLPGDAERHLERAKELRLTAAGANAQAADESRLAARALHDLGLGSTEIGVVLGVSRQRAHQLVTAGGTSSLPTEVKELSPEVREIFKRRGTAGNL